MSFPSPTSPSLRFGAFELDVSSGQLRKAGTLIKLQPQPFQLLLFLAERAGTVVTREEIRRYLWSDATFVDFEHGINFSINQIRSALADSADKPRYIETLPRRGYRFIAKVAHETPTTDVPIVQASSAPDDAVAIRGNGANSSSSLGPTVPVLHELTGKTGWRRGSVLAVVATAIAVLAFAGFAFNRGVFRRPRISFENLQISKLTDDGKAEQLAISPDGRYVAYAVRDAAESGLRVRQVNTRGDVQILLPDEDRERFLGLTFSPDANYIYYVQSSKAIASYNYLYKAHWDESSSDPD
jgi:DNA-binding winged helix-turn-helix (wHTH) protein